MWKHSQNVGTLRVLARRRTGSVLIVASRWHTPRAVFVAIAVSLVLGKRGDTMSIEHERPGFEICKCSQLQVENTFLREALTQAKKEAAELRQQLDNALDTLARHRETCEHGRN
jgi:hypothetical protein